MNDSVENSTKSLLKIIFRELRLINLFVSIARLFFSHKMYCFEAKRIRITVFSLEIGEKDGNDAVEAPQQETQDEENGGMFEMMDFFEQEKFFFWLFFRK